MGSKHTRISRAKKIGSYIVFLSVFCIILLFYVYQHIQAIRYGYEIETKHKQEYALRMKNDQILMEIKQYTSLPRLDQLAQTKLGLKTASRAEIVVLEIPHIQESKKDQSFIALLNRLLKKRK